MTTETKRPRGRPRDATCDRRILDAAREVTAELGVMPRADVVMGDVDFATLFDPRPGGVT